MITAREILDKARASGHRLPYNEAAVLYAATVRLAAAQDATLRGWLVLIDEAGGLHVGIYDEQAPEAEPALLAPELMGPSAPDKSDPKVQVYAAGVLGYELLTGKLPPTPGQAPGPELTGALGKVVRRALAADRRERIEDLKALYEEVEKVQPRPPAEGERNILSALRNRFSRPPPEKEAVAKLIDKLQHLEAQVAQLAKSQSRLDAAQQQSLETIERFEDGQRRLEQTGRRKKQSVVGPAVIAGLFTSIAVLAAAWALGLVTSPIRPPLPPVVTPTPAADTPRPEARPEPKQEPKPERKVEEKPAPVDASVQEAAAPVDAGAPQAVATAAPAAGESDAGQAAPVDAGPAHAAAPVKPAPVVPTKPAPPKPPVAKPKPVNPETAMLHAVAISQVRRGEAALEQGKADEALQSFQAALESEPNNAVAFRGMGMAYAMQGNDAEALKSYDKYLRLAPKAPDAAEIRQSIQELKARAKQGGSQ